MEFVQVRFKELRQMLGLSQREIAKELGMKQPTWAKLESGGVPDPRASTIAHICKTYNVSADWLLGFETDTDDLTNFEQFYAGVIDTICDMSDDELITEKAEEKLIHRVNLLKSLYDI